MPHCGQRGGGVNVPGGGANPPSEGGGASGAAARAAALGVAAGAAAAVVGRLRFLGGGFAGAAGCSAAKTGLGSSCAGVPDVPRSPDSPGSGFTEMVCGM
jgi:hypothetical protein